MIWRVYAWWICYWLVCLGMGKFRRHPKNVVFLVGEYGGNEMHFNDPLVELICMAWLNLFFLENEFCKPCHILGFEQILLHLYGFMWFSPEQNVNVTWLLRCKVRELDCSNFSCRLEWLDNQHLILEGAQFSGYIIRSILHDMLSYPL